MVTKRTFPAVLKKKDPWRGSSDININVERPIVMRWI
jgi:hypothetical protein